ncbi:MAG: DUF2842 domain-containing protein [Pseudomonadota bacterium]
MQHKTKKRLSLLILVVGIPLYIVVAVSVISFFDRPPIWLELAIYVALGFLWALPFRSIFRGVGQPGPGEPPIDKR